MSRLNRSGGGQNYTQNQHLDLAADLPCKELAKSMNVRLHIIFCEARLQNLHCQTMAGGFREVVWDIR